MIRLIRHTHLEPPNDFPVRRLLAIKGFFNPSPKRFVVDRPPLIYHPDQFLRVKAYLLEPTVSPGTVVIGLDAIEQHFTLFVPPPPKDAFLLEAGDAVP